ncbi:CPBP family intramembrane glutamic endopeptidase [Paenibacillus guangzhouensis]|uniref:CPBP family intramembrane glutamic endopeptidase n=1 Tax=Paenibacillus guangzhouensis TaxID=1473112 RepID=UPI00187B19E0|nr:type II CAAX endopeptidase family protein [Paenibacillus guangzhouensis]
MRRFLILGKVLLALVLFMGLGGVASSLVLGTDASGSEWKLVIISALSMMIPAMLLFMAFERGKGWSIGLRQSSAVACALQGIGLGILLISIVAIAIWICGGVEFQSVHTDADTWTSVLAGVGLFTLVAISEEVFNRGYLQGLLQRQYGVAAGVVISSIIFALLHGANPGIWSTPFTMINIFLIGIFFALTRVMTGGLWLPIGFHLAWNFFQGNVYGFAVSGTETKPILSILVNGDSLISGGSFGVEGSILTTILMVLVCGICMKLYAQREQNIHVAS